LVIESVEDEHEEGDEDRGPQSTYEPGPDVPTFEKDNIQFVSIFPLIHTPEFSNLRYFRVGDDKDMDECLTSRYGISHHTYCNPAGPLVERMPLPRAFISRPAAPPRAARTPAPAPA
jgi:hypothetical protein